MAAHPERRRFDHFWHPVDCVAARGLAGPHLALRHLRGGLWCLPVDPRHQRKVHDDHQKGRRRVGLAAKASHQGLLTDRFCEQTLMFGGPIEARSKPEIATPPASPGFLQSREEAESAGQLLFWPQCG